MSKVYTSHNLPATVDCKDYAHYCRTRSAVGLGVMPEELFDSIRGYEDEGILFDEL